MSSISLFKTNNKDEVIKCDNEIFVKIDNIFLLLGAFKKILEITYGNKLTDVNICVSGLTKAIEGLRFTCTDLRIHTSNLIVEYENQLISLNKKEAVKVVETTVQYKNDEFEDRINDIFSEIWVRVNDGTITLNQINLIKSRYECSGIDKCNIQQISMTEDKTPKKIMGRPLESSLPGINFGSDGSVDTTSNFGVLMKL